MLVRHPPILAVVRAGLFAFAGWLNFAGGMTSLGKLARFVRGSVSSWRGSRPGTSGLVAL